ncbi:MAG: MmcQ/YjbR family DNA-binding protein, partial [Eubacterium sp.]|nr:MmcQ/YjbR family DNA-binding protein [Eubacterium sp.]
NNSPAANGGDHSADSGSSETTGSSCREYPVLSGEVIDTMSEEEYLPLRIPAQQGEYVSTVRYEYTKLLKEIAMQIGIPVPFTDDQANRITYALAEKYGDVPDFPWASDEPDEDNEPGNYENAGVFRVPENQKWYGLIMYVPQTVLKTEEQKAEEKRAAEEAKRLRAEERAKRKAMVEAGQKPPKKAKKAAGNAERNEGRGAGANAGNGAGNNSGSTDEVRMLNIMNLKIDPDERQDLYRERGIFPAFHMNHKSWISIPLDGTLTDERVMELIDKSHALVEGGKGKNAAKRSARPDGAKTWIIPANPKYYDIVGIFDSVDDTIWKQGKGIRTGDICYMYVAVPYSAILYKVRVTKAYAEKDFGMDLMRVHIEERYDKKRCTLPDMKKFGVTTVRGPRFMPEDLERFIADNTDPK